MASIPKAPKWYALLKRMIHLACLLRREATARQFWPRQFDPLFFCLQVVLTTGLLRFFNHSALAAENLSIMPRKRWALEEIGTRLA